MFGLNDEDDKQDKPVGGPVDDAPVLPHPLSPPGDDRAVNPISGNATLGPPQVSSGLPSIIPGAGGTPPPSQIKKKQLMTGAPAGSPPPASPVIPPLPSALPQAPASAPRSLPPPLPDMATNDLLTIKKEALQSLTPLVDELDQPPPEKFKTLMMLLRASDNPSLVKEAYETANKITDEKAKAQALLDVVNEINYFTHPEKPVDSPTLS